ncbi:MAG: hypothetical protein KJZ68_03560 [Phycisphaerales bacterium]|nr:hypothetical protein [Phycisphaerales bacterium]
MDLIHQRINELHRFISSRSMCVHVFAPESNRLARIKRSPDLPCFGQNLSSGRSQDDIVDLAIQRGQTGLVFAKDLRRQDELACVKFKAGAESIKIRLEHTGFDGFRGRSPA